MGLTVAITGPTGDIGRALLRELDKAPEVERIIGMARRPFNPSELGLQKTEYRQGDILDKDSITTLVEGADVLVHLAFIILGGRIPQITTFLNSVPFLKPVLPDPGTPFQLVHHDDVAQALVASITGRGEPGIYNLAGEGTMSFGDFASALGWYSVPVPKFSV